VLCQVVRKCCQVVKLLPGLSEADQAYNEVAAYHRLRRLRCAAGGRSAEVGVCRGWRAGKEAEAEAATALNEPAPVSAKRALVTLYTYREAPPGANVQSTDTAGKL